MCFWAVGWVGGDGRGGWVAGRVGGEGRGVVGVWGDVGACGLGGDGGVMERGAVGVWDDVDACELGGDGGVMVGSHEFHACMLVSHGEESEGCGFEGTELVVLENGAASNWAACVSE